MTDRDFRNVFLIGQHAVEYCAVHPSFKSKSIFQLGQVSALLCPVLYSILL
jgi:hypothetical protein